MKDINDNIIYVGKAKNLNKRVRQYFGSYGQGNLKVKSMVSHINDFEYIIVENEIESLILESNLIKDNLPKYNILLRDDKQYPYIKITNEKFPRVIKTRKILKDGAKYFGPYPSATSVNESIDVFENLFAIRDCSLNLDKSMGKYRPCLNYFMNKCIGPCTGKVSESEYMEMINSIEDFLSGKEDNIIDILNEKMLEESKNMNYENAARYRDYINSLKLLTEKQIITTTDTSDNKDIIAVARNSEEVLVQVFFVRNGKMIGREHYFMRDYFDNNNENIIDAFIKQFYSGSAFIPKELIVEEEPNEKEILEKFLTDKRGSKVVIHCPVRGEKRELIRLVKKNAIDMIDKYGDKFKKKYELNILTLEEIKELLGLNKLPSRIEAYDISNTYGVESVGSMVVFENGSSKKSDYRKFKIKTVIGSNDYGSMKEVLTRRFSRGLEERKNDIDSSFSRFPDLIMMDGGKGQVGVAIDVLKNFNLDIDICGLVKDDFHNTRGIIYKNVEYSLDIDSRVYKMVYKIQEEAHRFAINYHKSLREQNIFKSELDDIENIGKVRKLKLMKHFKSIEKIKKATIEELSNVDSMNYKSAESLYNHFHRGENNNG